MAFRTFLLMGLMICGAQLQYANAQVVYKLEKGAPLTALNHNYKFDLVNSGKTRYAEDYSNVQLQKPDSKAQLSHYTKYSPSSTFALRNSPSPDDWLYEHNLVTVKSIIAIANRLSVGINCRYNWAFAIAGNGLGMVLNKAPIKISFAAVVGGAPNLCHR